MSLVSKLGRGVDAVALEHMRPESEWGQRAARSVATASKAGGIWWGASALLARRGPSGRRAATSAMTAWGTTTALVAATKKFVKRTRPRFGASGPPTSSTSMPSSHTASAFAYATAAGLAEPGAALPLLGSAGLVAWSRMGTARHFPSDVFAGASLGTAVGMLFGLLARHQRIPDPVSVRALQPS